MEKFTGKVWVLGDDIDTDIIIPTEYLALKTIDDMKQYGFSPLRPELAGQISKGDIIVAGKNFGCGSSREQAPEIIKALGIQCVIAKSFARIFFRNSINNGLLLIEQPDLHDDIKEGDEVIVKGSMVNYNGNTPQMSANNVVVSLNGSTTPPAVEATEVNNVLATTALPTGTPVKVNYTLTVGFANGSNVFACDEDGDFIQLYGVNTLKAGDVIPAGWEGTYTLYGDNTPEITFNEGALPAATEGTFTPKEVEATAITDALVNHVVTIKNVNFEEATPATKTDFTGTVGETTLNLFNQYELASVEAGKYDVTGVVAIRNLNGSPVAKLFVTNITKSETDSALLIGAGDNAAPVEYYNLQGIRIDNPANGIFIRRQGSKAQKIVL